MGRHFSTLCTLVLCDRCICVFYFLLLVSPFEARGLLWAMSADLVAATVKEFMADREVP